MAAISVVTFGPAAATSPHKVLQNSNTANANRDIIIIRKTESATKTKRMKKDPNQQRVSNPTPIAVARRNARERNRVKQVNNGFATLRQHIPAEIAAAFENQTHNSNGRNSGNKKLSKVETLRMAVEYIRSLEEILSTYDDSERGSVGNSLSSSTSLISFPSPTFSNSSQSFIYTNSGVDSAGVSPKGSTGYHQYIRISGTDTYQLVENPYGYEDEENVQPIVDEIASSHGDGFIESPLPDMVFDDSNMFHSNLSPYSDDSLSSMERPYPQQTTTVLPPIVVLQSRNNMFSPSHNSMISPRLSSPNNLSLADSQQQSVITNTANIMSSSIMYSPNSDCTIKTELPDDLSLEHGVIKTEEMVDVMDWWENGGKFNNDN